MKKNGRFTDQSSYQDDPSPNHNKSKTSERSKKDEKEVIKVSNKWLRNVHMLFLTIAEHESNIEEVRADLAALTDFSPVQLFKHINEERDDRLKVDEMVQFMFDNGVTGTDTNEVIVREMIQEFDIDLDGTLNYDEFLNLVLPATDEKLRNLCIRRSELDQG